MPPEPGDAAGKGKGNGDNGDRHASPGADDRAKGLMNKNAPLASIIRGLQQRHKKRQETATGGDGEKKAVVDSDALPPLQAPTGKEKEGGAAVDGLWVLGGATTVADLGIPTVAAFPKKGQESLGQVADQQVVATGEAAAGAAGGKDVLKREPETETPRSCRAGAWAGVKATCQEWFDIVKLYPSVLIAPVLLFSLLVGLGVWGVFAGANNHVQQQKDDVRSRAVDAATGFQIQLQQSFAPGVTFQLLVKQRPDLEYWLLNFDATATELLSRVPTGALWNLQLQPFAQVMMMSPYRNATDFSQVYPPRNLLADPGRRDDILNIIRTTQPQVVGPFLLTDGQGFLGAFVRYPIYVEDVDEFETFGFRYRENATALPYSQLPASVRGCTVCYNATTRTKWWGLLTALVNYDAVTKGEDAYLVNLRTIGYRYALVRPLNATSEQVIAQVGPTSLRDEDAVTVEVKVLNRVWFLRVAPENGFQPSWKGPLIAAVVVIALVISSLLFIALSSFKRQRLLLTETVAANQSLAETTRRLEEEKERMDVLLVRQYDLLRCLDANRHDKGGEDSVGASRKAMMARIEDARRSLNVAKSSVEDPIQVFEILGTGAFGKVQKGLWRGTVVAVKTMILPANMTGQQKREKMAVMEAAISSSLVHPNIVTTYTYFIRPYHEPTHEGVQNMLTNGEGNGGSSMGKASDTTFGDSEVSDATIHSYEVRLVLEFCDKGSLKDALDQHAFMQGGALNLSAMLETAADIAKAMVHMHAASVLHSDLKARNIMLKSSGMDGRGVVAKVADFGLSTRMEHQETHLSSCFQGTLTHMAPEVMLEGRISKAADVYSFGILMWELFCASDPFAGVPRAHMGHAITKENRRPKFPPFAPRDYVALASQCWHPDASQRPTFETVLSELTRMREELGGDTPQLVILPPKPPSVGGRESGASHGSSGMGGGSVGNHNNSGFALGNGGASTLLSAGIVVGGGGSSMGGSGMGGSGMGGSGSLASRNAMKSALAQRHLRKMGIRLGAGGSGLVQALPALQEEGEHREDGEHKEGGGGEGGGDEADSGSPQTDRTSGGSPESAEVPKVSSGPLVAIRTSSGLPIGEEAPP
ncbi:hypothetical protein HYH03_001413 [Edaphochlamys debaryana]|uniref:Protein kinase domain-containing protein n=1 Tax=Edaphochlamys debaryana TaxID=47281 RepID=A0A835YGR4_9CHLO|nr:hypothetical protein HYH03_001413 [Edaphochlamys debaryana]|eukprot:KAG2500646.1 hypothetical protein HYH03_001413 [Edaphochlamys debaryana]